MSRRQRRCLPRRSWLYASSSFGPQRAGQNAITKARRVFAQYGFNDVLPIDRAPVGNGSRPRRCAGLPEHGVVEERRLNHQYIGLVAWLVGPRGSFGGRDFVERTAQMHRRRFFEGGARRGLATKRVVNLERAWAVDEAFQFLAIAQRQRIAGDGSRARRSIENYDVIWPQGEFVQRLYAMA